MRPRADAPGGGGREGGAAEVPEGPRDAPIPVALVGGSAADVAALERALATADAPRFELRHLRDPEHAAERLLQEPPGVVVLDLGLEPAAFRAVEQRVHAASPAVPILVLAGPEQESSAWRAVQDGAQDYLLRGRWEPELVRRVVRHAIERQRLIAELEHRVAALEASQARFRTLIEKNADGAVIVDRAGVIRYVNPAAEALFGRAAREMVGEIFGFPIMAGETTEIDIVQRGGRIVTVELRAVETQWEGDEACLLSLRDITDRKRAEEKERELIREQAARQAAEAAREHQRQLAEENARLLREAQVANQAKANFLAVMSHELRTPLNAVIGYTDLLLAGVGGPIGEQQAHYLERIQTSSQHLLHLVDEILTFARTESGREVVDVQPIDLEALLREVAVIAEPLARRRGLEFRLELPRQPVEWATDAAKVRQILLNLLSNAVKFTDAGEVVLSGAPENGDVVLRVRDTGIGIAPEHHEAIFDAFWQVSQTATRTRGGTGLGLTVCRRLARLLGGDVSVESAPGRGSTFTVRLPRARPAPPADG